MNRISRPVLQIGATEIEDATDPTLIDVLLRRATAGVRTVVEGHHVDHAACLTASPWRGFSTVRANGFSQMICLPAFAALYGDLCVDIVRRADIDNVNIRG